MDKLDSAGKGFRSFQRKNRKYLFTIFVFLNGLLLFLYQDNKSDFSNRATLVPSELISQLHLGDFKISVPTVKYGFVLDTFSVVEDKVKRNQTIGGLLASFGVSPENIQRIIENSKGVFNVQRNFQVGKSYTLLSDTEKNRPLWFIFEPNAYEYIVFDLGSVLSVNKVEREVEKRQMVLSGRITSSLWMAIEEAGAGYEIATKMEDALETSVDFSHAQVGDEFKLIYEEHLIEGERVGVGAVHAASYCQSGKEHLVFYFDDGNKNKGYYDVEGRPMKSRFLMAPVKYTRISSRFNPRRFHPVLKRSRPHLGTDYAAPHGTPIYSVGNGSIAEKGYTSGNGNYIKIKHDKVYLTQYLHMSRFAKGIRKGSPVSQGQVIGYVGSTGLATGPHVCFRFWKNGRQVNHLREYLPPAPSLPSEILPEYFKVRDGYLKLILEPAVDDMLSVP